MKIKALFLSVLFLALLGPSALHAAKHRRPDRAPVLVLESSNSEGVSLLLTVYNDGGSALARKDEDSPEGELCTAQAPAASLQTLQAALRHAGALHLRSQPPTAGFSRKTVSFFITDEEAARTQGNTFVYYVRQDSYLVIETAVLNFISDNFGNCV
jgi:hypothetical protein